MPTTRQRAADNHQTGWAEKNSVILPVDQGSMRTHPITKASVNAIRRKETYPSPLWNPATSTEFHSGSTLHRRWYIWRARKA